MNNTIEQIPRRIHYCWFGNKPKSKLIMKCITSWKKFCPDYEIVEWNETNFDLTVNDYVKEAYEEKKYAFVSDYARLWAVYHEGGIYLDTDVELIKGLDDFLQYEAFFASENNVLISTGLGFGAVKNNEIVKAMMDDYENIHFRLENGKHDRTTCPVRNTRTLKDRLGITLDLTEPLIINNVCMLPKEYFCPLEYETKKMNKTKNTHAIHWYNASWLGPSRKIYHALKRILKIKH